MVSLTREDCAHFLREPDSSKVQSNEALLAAVRGLRGCGLVPGESENKFLVSFGIAV
jgi:hypothetical protein